MNDPTTLVSEAFQAFQRECPEHARAWMNAVRGLGAASALEEKTHALAYLAVLAVMGLESGLAFHVAHAKRLGASRDEVASALLVGLPAAGNAVIQSLPAALRAYDGV